MKKIQIRHDPYTGVLTGTPSRLHLANGDVIEFTVATSISVLPTETDINVHEVSPYLLPMVVLSFLCSIATLAVTIGGAR